MRSNSKLTFLLKHTHFAYAVYVCVQRGVYADKQASGEMAVFQQNIETLLTAVFA